MDQTTWSLYDFLATYKVDVQFVGHWHQVCVGGEDGVCVCGQMDRAAPLALTRGSSSPRHNEPALQYTRYPPIDSRNGKTVIDAKAVSGARSSGSGLGDCDAPHILRPSAAALAADKGTYTDAAYPTVIVTGAPGDQEVDPRTCSEANQVYCSGNYGYGWFTAVNATAAHWTWKTTVPVKGSPDATFSDDLWFVKTA